MSNLQDTARTALLDAPARRRLADGEPVGPIWAITLAGFAAWLAIGSLYATARTIAQGQPSPATSPATRPQIKLSAHETVVLGVVVSVGVLATLAFGSAALRPRGLQRLGLSRSAMARGIALGLAWGLLIIPLVYAMALLSQGLLKWLDVQHPDAHPLLRILGQQQGDPVLGFLVLVSATVLAPASEELLFRGHLQTAILHSLDRTASRRGARWTAILITSVVFALFHGEIWMMPPIFFLSLCLGMVYERSGNLWMPMAIHLLFNASSLGVFWWQLVER